MIDPVTHKTAFRNQNQRVHALLIYLKERFKIVRLFPRLLVENQKFYYVF